jgi:integrase
MSKHHPQNERVKRRYYAYLKEAQRYSDATIDGVAKALARFEEDTQWKDFKRFHQEQAIAFKRHLAEQRSLATGERLSKATAHATLANLKRFFHWLAREPGYKSRMQYSDADYFNLSDKDTRIATAHREPRVPTLEQIKHVLATIPAGTDIERRDRALIAFTLMTGARDSAIASMKLKHVDLETGLVRQDAREVRTKYSKTFTTYFFPVGPEARSIVFDWINYLRLERLWGNDDPLFPATEVTVGSDQHFRASGLRRECWSSAGPIRAAFRSAFVRSGLPYFNPHSFRHTLVDLGESVCRNPQQFKAWSQNLGHEGVLTTFCSYGTVGVNRQREIFQELGAPKTTISAINELVEEFVRKLHSGR